MGLLDAIKAKLGSEDAQLAVEHERTAREKEAFQKRTDRETKIAQGRSRGELSESSAQRLRETAARKEQIEKQLPRERVAGDLKKVGARLEKGVSRIAADLAKPQKRSGTLHQEKTFTDKSGKTTTIKTYYKPPKQSQPRGRPRSYHAPRGGFKAPSGSGGGGLPRGMMSFDVPNVGGMTALPKRKKNGKKSPMDPFNFDMDF